MDINGIIEMMARRIRYREMIEQAEKERQLQAAKKETKVVYGSNLPSAKRANSKTDNKNVKTKSGF